MPDEADLQQNTVKSERQSLYSQSFVGLAQTVQRHRTQDLVAVLDFVVFVAVYSKYTAVLLGDLERQET